METVTEYGKIRNYDKYISISSINLLHEKYPKRPQVQLTVYNRTINGIS